MERELGSIGISTERSLPPEEVAATSIKSGSFEEVPEGSCVSTGADAEADARPLTLMFLSAGVGADPSLRRKLSSLLGAPFAG